MLSIRSATTALSFLLLSYIGLAQQLKLGKNPYTVQKSAILELQSDNQGLLLTRITDTTAINAIAPPDGMVIYFTPTKRVLVRANGYWQSLPTTIDTSSIANFYLKTRSLFSGTAPLTYNSATGVFGITQASATTNGYLSSADWNTFNNKAGAFTTGNLTETGSGILTIGGGTNAVIGSGTTIQVKQANTSQSGFLSSTDWNTFNNKLSTVDTGNISNFSVKVRSLHAAGTGLSYNTSTGVFSNTGVLSLNGNTGALTMDTGYISNFSVKTRGLFSGTAPITFNNATGAIGITQASATTNGYLSSADWNTFNNKAGAFTTGNLTETGSGILTITGGTGAVAGSGTTIQVKQANTSQNGFLSSTDWNTFNNKLSTIDTTNISNFSVKVRSLHSAGTGLTYNTATGAFANAGVLSVNGNTGALTMDTGYISNFSVKTRGLFSGTAPITFNSATGAIGITQASSTTNGYLSSADWNTFNNKAGAFTTGNLTETGSGILTITGGTGAVAGSGTTIQVKQANTSQSGFLSSTDWNTFNNKLSTIDTTNISNFSVKVRSLHAAGIGLSYNTSTGVFSNTGVLSLNGNTGALTMDTGYISSFSVKTRSLFAGTAPITYSNGTIGITQASASTNGYLSSADWNTFNNKAGAFTTGNLTETGSGILTITGGTGAVAGSGTTIQVKQANTSQNGFLSSTDWNTFNNKLSTVDTGNISNFSVKVRSLHSAGTGLTYNAATGAFANAGVLSVNGNTGALTIDTGYISNFSVKTKSLFSGTAPITFNGATGAIGITQASATTNGYLSSADWNTFNNKAGAFTTGNLTEIGSGILTITGGTGAVAGSGTTIQVKQATTSQSGFLSSTDWNTFNNKLSTIDTTNISNFSVKVRSLHSAGTGLTYNAATGAFANAGVLSVNGNTGALTMDTGYISNFYLKSRSLLSAGTGITYNAATGVISSTASTANLWAFNGNTVGAAKTIGTIDNYDFPFITNNTERMRLSNAGNLGIGSTSFDATYPEKLLVNAGTTSSVNAIAGKGSINNYLQLNIQNQSAGSNASSDVVATADNGNETNNYIDMGINSSANSSGAMGNANDAYLYNIGQNLLVGTGSASKSLVFMTGGTSQSANERMRIDGSGRVGIGVTNPTNPLTVKDTLEIRRTGTMSSLLFSNTAGSGDFRIGGDGGDLFWQGGGGRNLQMGAYWGIVLAGDRQTSTFPAFSSGTANTNVLIQSQRDGSTPLGIQANSATQTANLTEWRSSTGSVLSVVDENANFGIGTSNPTAKLHVEGTNPLSLYGVQTGTNTSTDSILTISSGVVKKLPASTFGAASSSWLLGGNAVSTMKNFGTTDNNHLPFITNNVERMRLSNTGNLGVGTTTFDGTNPEKLLVNAGTTSSVNAIAGKGTINSYLQLNIQNQSTGTAASSDVVATADNGDESNNYVDMGINGSNYAGGVMGAANDSYLYNIGQNFLIGTGTAAKSLVFMTGGTSQSANERMRIDGTGKVGIGTNAPASDLTLFQANGGANPARGFRFTGNSISGNNSGTGFSLALGYNITNNKQLWLGDADYLGSSSGTFLRYSITNGFPTFDAVAGDGASRRSIALGVGGDPTSAIILGGDFTATAPSSYIWGNGNMAIGASYRANAAPTNGLIVQGNTGIGLTSPTAALQLRAGTATASSGAPLKFTSGTNLTTAEDGAVEYDGTNYYATSGTTRYTLAKTLTATASLDFPSVTGIGSSTLTISVAGAADGDVVSLGVPNALASVSGVVYSAYVSSPGVVTVRYTNNNSLSAINPAAATFRVTIIKY
ncbi:MAG: hypothetical protein QM726_01855 [Chitinophagaceae bacterium]